PSPHIYSLSLHAALPISGAGYVALSAVLKMVVFPLVITGVVLITGLQGTAAMTLIIYGVIPTASSGYALAKLLGADADVMAGIRSEEHTSELQSRENLVC